MKFFEVYKKEILSFFGCFLLFLGMAFWSYHFIISEYKKSFVDNNAFVLNHLVEKHPELEHDMMEIFQRDDKNYDLSILKRYGFLNEDSLNYIDFVEQLEVKTKQIVFCSFLISFVLFLLLVLFFSFQKERRIKELHEYLFRVLKNDYEMDLKDYREDGLSSFKSDLLKVTNKLRNISDNSLKDKKNLERTLSDISHQLRTPLTSLSVINDVLRNPKIKDHERIDFLNQQKEQLERMEWLIVTLLKMSQIDSGTIEFQLKEVFVQQILEEALKPSLIPLELKQIECKVSVPDQLVCNLDFHWTIEALINLIKNAMEHTPVKGMISIEASDNPMYIEIVIKDTGSGILKEDLPHIFERFYKGKAKTDSIGIGLNLSKSIIEKQNGTIHVESEVGKGTTFIIHFFKVIV